MKLLQKIKKVPKTKNGHKYLPTLSESVPYYVRVNDDLEVITETVKVYDPEKEKIITSEIEISYTQNQINYMLKTGVQIELITPIVLERIKADKIAYELVLEAAEMIGFEKGSKIADNQFANAEIEYNKLIAEAQRELKEAQIAIKALEKKVKK